MQPPPLITHTHTHTQSSVLTSCYISTVHSIRISSTRTLISLWNPHRSPKKKKSTVTALGNAWTTTETHVRVNHTVHRHDDTCVATESHAQFCRDLRHKKQREGEASREQADGEHTSRRRQITASRSHVHRPHTLIMCSSFMSRSNKDIISQLIMHGS